MERDRREIEREEKKLVNKHQLRGERENNTRQTFSLCFQELEIKKLAKEGNAEGCKILAKQLLQLRKQKTRTYAASSKVYLSI